MEEAKEAVANGQNVPEMPTLNEEKTKAKNGDSNGDAENGNEENTRNDFGGKDSFFFFCFFFFCFFHAYQRRRLRRTTSSSLFNSVEESSEELSGLWKYRKVRTILQMLQKEKSSSSSSKKRSLTKNFAVETAARTVRAVKTEEASISEGLAAMKMAAC